ncbi:MAG: hypothetical protein IKD92_04110 [Lachnospiraceae bacterium]|nr:hypothetical protein [Lachnospiraceae bacterium]
MKKNRRRSSRIRRWVIPVLAAVLVVVILRLVTGIFFNKNQEASVPADRGVTGTDSASGAGTASEASAAGSSAWSTAAYALTEENAGSDKLSPEENTGTASAEESGQKGSPDGETTAGGADLGVAAEDSLGAASTGPDETAAAKESPDQSGSGATGAEETAEPAYDHTATELEEGRDYLRMLENRSPVDTAQQIEDARKEYQLRKQLQEYSAKRDAYRQELEENGVWDAFDDYVFLGDSRVVGFDVYGFLAADRVLAESGDTINAITDRLDTVRSYDPKYVFLSYGINDIGVGLWPTPEEYADAYEDKIDALREALPDAEIYVNSILPATQYAVEGSPVWGGLPEYSEAVRRMCERKEIPFIDNDALVEERGNLYEQDGVHFQPDFYYYWAENQLLAVFDLKQGYLTFRDPLQDMP